MRARCDRWLMVSIATSLLAGPATAASSCMYDAAGKVVFRPDGAECRDVATASKGEFSVPREIPGAPWLDIRPGDEQLFEVEIKHGLSHDGEPFKYTTYAGTQHREVIE